MELFFHIQRFKGIKIAIRLFRLSGVLVMQ